MTVQLLVFLMIALCLGILFSGLAGFLAFGIARLVGAPVDKAIAWGSAAALSIMTLVITMLGIVLPLVT